MKITPFAWGISFFILLSCNTHKEKSYPDADAVYLNLKKTFVLNKDGSIVNSVEKKQKLFTYRAFQSLYGETRITYNPEFQKLVVNEAYTTNSGNQTIKTPENGFNEVLPPICQNSKAYNQLREMVVSHTGLDRNALINCSYNVTTAAGKIPFLMGIEELQTDCPIENLTIIVQVPSSKKLHYKSLNFTSEPVLEIGNELDTYTWKFHDLAQRPKEIQSALVGEDIPALLFSTQKDQSIVINWYLGQLSFTNSIGDAAKKYVDNVIKDKKSWQEKALKVQEIVVNEIKTLQIPGPLTAFRARPADEIWQSNSGTVPEKAILLTTLLRSEGFNAELCLNVPESLSGEKLPFLLVAEPIVKISGSNSETLLLAADRLNSGNSDFGYTPFRVLPLNIAHQALAADTPKSKIQIEGKLKINDDSNLQGELTGQFTGSFNPYFEIIRNQGKCPQFLSGFRGTVGKSTAELSNISFKVESSDQLIKRENFRFLDLVECKTGISSFHLIPMSFTRNSAFYLGTTIDESYHYSFTLPATRQLVNPVNIELLKPGIGHVLISLKQTGSVVEVIRKIGIFNPVIAKKDYADFRELIDKWNTHKFKQLIIK